MRVENSFSHTPPLMTAWFSLASKALRQPTNQKIWYFIDELPSLHKLPDLPQALAEARKYGGRFVIGLQALSQLDEIYGSSTTRSLCSLTGTKIIFRSPDSSTAKRLSEFLGEQEVMEQAESISFGAHHVRDGVSLSDQKRQKPLVPYSELMTLGPLEAYLQLPREFPITKVTFSYHPIADKEPAFLARHPQEKGEEQEADQDETLEEESLIKIVFPS